MIHSLRIDRHDAIKVASDSIIISKSSEETRRREILSYSLLGSKASDDVPEIPHIVWRLDSPDKEVLPSPCSILPMNSENFVLGYCKVVFWLRICSDHFS